MGDRKKHNKDKTSSRIPLEPEIVVEEKEGTETDKPQDSRKEEIACSNEQISSIQKAIENGFTSMASSMGSIIQQAFSTWEENMLRDDELESEDGEHDSPPEGRENDGVTLDSLIGEKSSQAQNNEKSSNEVSKANALESIKQDLNVEEIGEAIDEEFATVITNLLTKGMQDERLQERMNKMARPSNCEALTKVKINQLVWDNLSSNIRSQDLRMQKVQTSLIRGLTGVVRATDKILSCLNDIPVVGKDVTQLLSDSVVLLANANNELNMRRKELIKPDLHHDYKHLCSSSIQSTSWLFGDELPKQVKDLTEVNRVGRKVTHSQASKSTGFGYKSRSSGSNYNRSRNSRGFLGSRGGSNRGNRWRRGSNYKGQSQQTQS